MNTAASDFITHGFINDSIGIEKLESNFFRKNMPAVNVTIIHSHVSKMNCVVSILPF